MSHPNAALTPRHRLKVARLVVDDGWPISEVAARFQVPWPTVKRWVDRYLGGEPMQDRSSRPRRSPTKTPTAVTKRCVSLRLRLGEEPVQFAARFGIAPSTVHRILRSARLNRLTYLDRATGEPVRRYEHDHPGSLVHVDVMKLGNIPDGGACGATRAKPSRSGRSSRALTVRRPTARSSGSTAPWPTAGPTPVATPASNDAETLWCRGCTSTTKHRPHTACGSQPPFSRLINLPDQLHLVGDV